MTKSHCSVVVLISGNGTNLQALIDDSTHSNYKITAVISNKPEAFGLSRAQRSGIPALTINHKDYSSRELFDHALMETIDTFNPDIIVLAGFMRILSAEFVKHYCGKILNIHPSLLPAYTGTNTHQRVLDAGEKYHGVSVHFVTEELDGGPVISQEKIKIEADDNADSLANKIHQKEHIIYPKTVSWFAAGRLHMNANRAYLDNDLLPETGIEISPL
ncbi:MAG: phosphoribosylglycinamide formyltransferase [SAR86 cluster bacterium]|uniref:Phosphoribosylglycinamide formyltransferase n=1 Tax=SAR86 cluster bacterium TaxID=2030880 RepID=A0A2A5AFJ0_9GAMM|nr:MAG: phosphoribosylglycinamide formyltransferase [SAR86 cluster bacterium]